MESWTVGGSWLRQLASLFVMLESRPNLYIGYHGCSEKHGEEFLLLGTRKKIHISEANYEWLGKGFYIWENNFTRAYEWRAKEYKTTEKPFVVGVIYSLDECLDLTDSKYLELVSQAYANLKLSLEMAGKPLPQNEEFSNHKSGIRGKRLLDFAVLERLHYIMDNPNKEKQFEPWINNGTVVKPFDTVRSAFFEGNPSYPGSTFQDKNHIQICIRNPKCIKGFFRPLDMD